MIKTILSTLILATVSLTASAEYTIKVPLEVAQGGTLPNGSISFSNEDLTPSVPEVPEVPELTHIEKCGDILKSLDSSFERVGTSSLYSSNAVDLLIFDFPEGTNISAAGYQMMTDKGVDVLCSISVGNFDTAYYSSVPLADKLNTKISYLNLLASKMGSIEAQGIGLTNGLYNDLASIRSQANDNIMEGLINNILNNPTYNNVRARNYYSQCYNHSGGIYSYCTDGAGGTNFQAQMYITNNSGSIGNYYSSPTLNFEVFLINTFN